MRIMPALAALTMLAACANGGALSTTPGTGPLNLQGAWVLDQGRGPGGNVEPPAGTRITILFDGNQVSGQACNHYGGDFQLAGSAIRFSAMATTEMACEEPIMAAEAAYHAALGEVRSVAIDGERLVLRGGSSELVFTRLPDVSDAALDGTFWTLDSLISGDAVASVQADGWLQLNADGTMAGSTGCRGFDGEYTVSGDQVVATTLIMEDPACTAELRDQDAAVVEVLEGGFAAEVNGETLTLSRPDGTGLVYRAGD